jgi:transcriptional regulator with XRE-family HTH domain
MGLNVTFAQGPKVTHGRRTFGPMEVSNPRESFANRMNEVCDLLNITRGHGRQAALGRTFGVTPKGARKWLGGEGFPEMDLAIRIANAAHVNINWLLQGVGPKHGEQLDPSTEILSEGVEGLPQDDRQQVFDFIRYRFEKADGWFASDKLSRYMVLLDALVKPAGKK